MATMVSMSNVTSFKDFDKKRAKGNTWFVVGGESGTIGSNSNDGKTWDTAWATLTYALTQVTAHDTIYVSTGSASATLLEGATLAITTTGLKIIGVQTSPHTFGMPSIHTHGTETLITINATGVEIANLSFHMQGAGTCIANGTTAATWRTHIHDCYFGGNDTALIGIDAGGTYDAPFTVIENCHFQGFKTEAINLNAFNSMVKGCLFLVGTADIGINYVPNGADRPFGYILDNRFTTTDSTDAVGINVANTPTAGYLYVDGNRFQNFASNNACISKRTGYTGLNYLGITAIAIT